jgi:hypothetical protein
MSGDGDGAYGPGDCSGRGSGYGDDSGSGVAFVGNDVGASSSAAV